MPIIRFCTHAPRTLLQQQCAWEVVNDPTSSLEYSPGEEVKNLYDVVCAWLCVPGVILKLGFTWVYELGSAHVSQVDRTYFGCDKKEVCVKYYTFCDIAKIFGRGWQKQKARRLCVCDRDDLRCSAPFP